jgi:transposase-like protein
VDTTRQGCENTACADFVKTEGRNLKVHSYTERRYYCTTCKHTFSFDKGTFFATLRTERQPLLEAVALRVERNSLRAICRSKQGKLQTVLHWVDLAGQHAAAISNHFMRGLHVTQAQIDELWTFVKKNRSTFNPMTPAVSATLG